MILCKDCKYWTYKEFDTDIQDIKSDFDVRLCVQPDLKMLVRPAVSNGLSVCDGDDYKAFLYTGADFGCINGVEKG